MRHISGMPPADIINVQMKGDATYVKNERYGATTALKTPESSFLRVLQTEFNFSHLEVWEVVIVAA